MRTKDEVIEELRKFETDLLLYGSAVMSDTLIKDAFQTGVVKLTTQKEEYKEYVDFLNKVFSV